MVSIRRTLTSITLAGLMVAAFMVVAGASASSALAAGDPCYQVVEAGTGSFNDSNCTEAGGGKEYIKVESGTGKSVGGNVWCFHVSAGEPSQYKNNVCTEKESGGGYVKVYGPRLVIAGVVQNNTTSHELETRIKSGTTFGLKSKVGATEFTLTSTEVKSTEAEIVGSQPPTDSAKAITFTGVKVTSPSSCNTDEVSSRTSPTGTKTAIGTVATKPVSTLFEPGGASGIADTFTPVLEEGKEIFVEIQLKAPRGSECPIPTEYYKVTGHESGEGLEPDTEAEWKTLKFPVTSLSSLSFGGEPATLEGEAELRLIPGHEHYTIDS